VFFGASAAGLIVHPLFSPILEGTSK